MKFVYDRNQGSWKKHITSNSRVTVNVLIWSNATSVRWNLICIGLHLCHLLPVLSDSYLSWFWCQFLSTIYLLITHYSGFGWRRVFWSLVETNYVDLHLWGSTVYIAPIYTTVLTEKSEKVEGIFGLQIRSTMQWLSWNSNGSH